MIPYLIDIVLAFVVAIGFAVLFQTPKRVLHVAGLLGGLGHCIRFALLSLECPLIPATLGGTVFIGLAGIVLSHKVHTPPVVFTMPACITMIPGLFAYRAMLGCLKITDLEYASAHPEIVTVTMHYFVLTVCLLFTLAIGICVGALLFRKRSSKSLFRRIF